MRHKTQQTQLFLNRAKTDKKIVVVIHTGIYIGA